ncbi:response regulator transcription factor [Methanosphaerula subterraneus]|uniref:response regulator transcription factor n=1 Tax=Methanosphaerula subterraneus TaxID=3350244 RepID=UPI003F8766F3
MIGMPVHVVIIDDDPEIQKLLRVKLERDGYLVETASDGRAGVTKVVASHPDLMIVDIMLPVLDGLDLIREVREALGAESPVCIILSARREVDDIAAGIAAGADDYITKPFSPRELLERMTVALLRRGKQPAAGGLPRGHSGEGGI